MLCDDLDETEGEKEIQEGGDICMCIYIYMYIYSKFALLYSRN